MSDGSSHAWGILAAVLGLSLSVTTLLLFRALKVNVDLRNELSAQAKLHGDGLPAGTDIERGQRLPRRSLRLQHAIVDTVQKPRKADGGAEGRGVQFAAKPVIIGFSREVGVQASLGDAEDTGSASDTRSTRLPTPGGVSGSRSESRTILGVLFGSGRRRNLRRSRTMGDAGFDDGTQRWPVRNGTTRPVRSVAGGARAWGSGPGSSGSWVVREGGEVKGGHLAAASRRTRRHGTAVQSRGDEAGAGARDEADRSSSDGSSEEEGVRVMTLNDLPDGPLDVAMERLSTQGSMRSASQESRRSRRSRRTVTASSAEEPLAPPGSSASRREAGRAGGRHGTRPGSGRFKTAAAQTELSAPLGDDWALVWKLEAAGRDGVGTSAETSGPSPGRGSHMEAGARTADGAAPACASRSDKGVQAGIVLVDSAAGTVPPVAASAATQAGASLGELVDEGAQARALVVVAAAQTGSDLALSNPSTGSQTPRPAVADSGVQAGPDPLCHVGSQASIPVPSAEATSQTRVPAVADAGAWTGGTDALVRLANVGAQAAPETRDGSCGTGEGADARRYSTACARGAQTTLSLLLASNSRLNAALAPLCDASVATLPNTARGMQDEQAARAEDTGRGPRSDGANVDGVAPGREPPPSHSAAIAGGASPGPPSRGTAGARAPHPAPPPAGPSLLDRFAFAGSDAMASVLAAAAAGGSPIDRRVPFSCVAQQGAGEERRVAGPAFSWLRSREPVAACQALTTPLGGMVSSLGTERDPAEGARDPWPSALWEGAATLASALACVLAGASAADAQKTLSAVKLLSVLRQLSAASAEGGASPADAANPLGRPPELVAPRVACAIASVAALESAIRAVSAQRSAWAGGGMQVPRALVAALSGVRVCDLAASDLAAVTAGVVAACAATRRMLSRAPKGSAALAEAPELPGSLLCLACGTAVASAVQADSDTSRAGSAAVAEAANCGATAVALAARSPRGDKAAAAALRGLSSSTSLCAVADALFRNATLSGLLLPLVVALPASAVVVECGKSVGGAGGLGAVCGATLLVDELRRQLCAPGAPLLARETWTWIGRLASAVHASLAPKLSVLASGAAKEGGRGRVRVPTRARAPLAQLFSLSAALLCAGAPTSSADAGCGGWAGGDGGGGGADPARLRAAGEAMELLECLRGEAQGGQVRGQGVAEATVALLLEGATGGVAARLGALAEALSSPALPPALAEALERSEALIHNAGAAGVGERHDLLLGACAVLSRAWRRGGVPGWATLPGATHTVLAQVCIVAASGGGDGAEHAVRALAAASPTARAEEEIAEAVRTAARSTACGAEGNLAAAAEGLAQSL